MASVLAERGDEYVPPRSVLDRELRLVVATIPDLVVFVEKQIGDPVEMPHQVDCVVEQPRKLILEADGRAWHQRIKDMAVDGGATAGRRGSGTRRFATSTERSSTTAKTVRQEILDYLHSGTRYGA